MGDEEKVKAASELVRNIGGLPAIVLAILLLFPQAVAGFVLFRLDSTMERLATAIEAAVVTLNKQAPR